MKCFTKKIRFQILHRDNYTCVYCGITANKSQLHIDHINPKSNIIDNSFSNLVTACQSCNSGKSDFNLINKPYIANNVLKNYNIIYKYIDKIQVAIRDDNEFINATLFIKTQEFNKQFNFMEYLRTKSTIKFMEELSKKYGEIKLVEFSGKNTSTWVHPILFIDIALSISPILKVETYEWLFDNLIKFRNDSGDNYKIMAGYLFVHTKNKSNFHKEIAEIANKIQLACNIKDWQLANESQLQLRNKIHNDIALLADVLNDNNQAVAIAIRKAINN